MRLLLYAASASLIEIEIPTHPHYNSFFADTIAQPRPDYNRNPAGPPKLISCVRRPSSDGASAYMLIERLTWLNVSLTLLSAPGRYAAYRPSAIYNEALPSLLTISLPIAPRPLDARGHSADRQLTAAHYCSSACHFSAAARRRPARGCIIAHLGP